MTRWLGRYVQLKHTYADKAAAMDRDRFVHRMIKSHGDSIAISMVRGGEYMSGRRIASSLVRHRCWRVEMYFRGDLSD